jgi:hypothetical protein
MTSDTRQQFRQVGSACILSFFISAAATYLFCALTPKKRGEMQGAAALSDRITLSESSAHTPGTYVEPAAGS